MMRFFKRTAAEKEVVSESGELAAPSGTAALDTIELMMELVNQIQVQTDVLIKEDGASTNNFNSLLSNEHYTKAQIQDVQQHLVQVGTSSNQTKELLDSAIGELNRSFEELSQARQRNETMVSEMNRVIEVFAQFRHLVTEMDQEYRQIEKFAAVISEIADQTKLLSLNASIEAARAGELGKGFGVVAEEIKKLSESTQSNAKNIISSLSAMTAIVGKLNTKTSEGTQMMPTTKRMVEDSFQVLNTIEHIEDSLVNH